LKRLHAAFYDGERLLAHRSVVLSDTIPPLQLPMCGAPPKLIANIGRPLHAIFERGTQSVQRQQIFNNTDDVRGRRGSVKKPQGAMFYGLPYVSYFLSLCRDNKGRAGIVKPIETEQGIAIERRNALRTDDDFVGVQPNILHGFFQRRTDLHSKGWKVSLDYVTERRCRFNEQNRG
jgi:hypothetical protein